nr:immunoglobulin light chain junction region [Macaca mulatta]
CGQTTNVPFTF